MLLECWVSKASAKQRRGRAGRVRPGVCFHMCSSGTFQDTISEFQVSRFQCEPGGGAELHMKSYCIFCGFAFVDLLIFFSGIFLLLC